MRIRGYEEDEDTRMRDMRIYEGYEVYEGI